MNLIQLVKSKKKFCLAKKGFSYCVDEHGENLLQHLNSVRTQPNLTGPLMRQAPPGLVAEPFALGIISSVAWELENGRRLKDYVLPATIFLFMFVGFFTVAIEDSVMAGVACWLTLFLF